MRYTRLRRAIENGTLIGTHGTPFQGSADKNIEAQRKRKRLVRDGRDDEGDVVQAVPTRSGGRSKEQEMVKDESADDYETEPSKEDDESPSTERKPQHLEKELNTKEDWFEPASDPLIVNQREPESSPDSHNAFSKNDRSWGNSPATDYRAESKLPTPKASKQSQVITMSRKSRAMRLHRPKVEARFGTGRTLKHEADEFHTTPLQLVSATNDTVIPCGSLSPATTREAVSCKAKSEEADNGKASHHLGSYLACVDREEYAIKLGGTPMISLIDWKQGSFMPTDPSDYSRDH